MLVRNPGIKYTPLPAPRPRPADDGCAQPCPECGGLQCLCRPRFFAGQLLTEDDLNRLDRYIVEKNKLHNRYLHGWGVVCGLEVVCHPCDDAVIVRPGYALSPCGEDIILCDQTSVPVCDLIKACKDQQRSQWECEPYPYGQDDDCKDQCQEWVLTVRYDEKPSRGMTPLGGQNGGCSSCSGSDKSCGCNGNCAGSGGGCGCGGKAVANGSRASSATTRIGSTSTSRRTLQQCEPTTTCEGFKFEMSRYKPTRAGYSLPGWNKSSYLGPQNLSAVSKLGQLTGAYQGNDAMSDCLGELLASIPPSPGQEATPEQLYAWCCQTKQAIQDYLQTHPTYDCQLDEKIAAIRCPLPAREMNEDQRQQYFKDVEGVRSALVDVAKAYLDYCKCSALLPQCPDPVDDPRVPLAIITICGDGCKVMRVCNLGVRKYVITFPLIERYLQGLGLSGWFQTKVQELCCPPDEVKMPPQAKPAPVGLVGNLEKPVIGGWVAKPVRTVRYARTPETGVRNLSRLALGALARPERTLDTYTLLAGALGAVDPDGMPLATNLEVDNPLQALLVNSLVAPLLQNLIPAELGDVVQALAGRVVAADREGESQDVALSRMQGELESLRKTAADQQASIATLLDALGKMKKE